MAESEEIFEVEAILGRRQDASGQIEYLIRWGGYNSDWDSWEPLTGLQTALEIVAEYEEQQALKTLCDNSMNKMRTGRKYKSTKEDILPSYDNATTIWNSLDNRLSPPESTSSLSDINEKIDPSATNLGIFNENKAQMNGPSKRTTRVPSQDVTPTRGLTSSRRTRLDSTGSTASILNQEMLPPSKISPISKVVGRKLSPARSPAGMDTLPEQARGVPTTRRVSRADSVNSLTSMSNGEDIVATKTSPVPKKVGSKLSPRHASNTGEPASAGIGVRSVTSTRRSSQLDLPGPTASVTDAPAKSKASPVAKVVPQKDSLVDNTADISRDTGGQGRGRGKVKKGPAAGAPPEKKAKTSVKTCVVKKTSGAKRAANLTKDLSQIGSVPADTPLSIDCDSTSPVLCAPKSPARSPSVQRMSPRVSNMQKSPPHAAPGSPQSASPRESAHVKSPSHSPRQAGKRAAPSSPTTSPLMIRRLFGSDVKSRGSLMKAKAKNPTDTDSQASSSDEQDSAKEMPTTATDSKPSKVDKKVSKVVKGAKSEKDLREPSNTSMMESAVENLVDITTPSAENNSKNDKSKTKKLSKPKMKCNSDDNLEALKEADVSNSVQTEDGVKISIDKPTVKKKQAKLVPKGKPGPKIKKEKVKFKKKRGRPFQDPARQAAAELILNQGIAQAANIKDEHQSTDGDNPATSFKDNLKKTVSKNDKPRKVISKKVPGRLPARPSKSVALIAMKYSYKPKKPVTRGKTDVLKNLGMSPKKSSPKKTDVPVSESEVGEVAPEKAASKSAVDDEQAGLTTSSSTELEAKPSVEHLTSELPANKKVPNATKKPGKPGPKPRLKPGPKPKQDGKVSKAAGVQAGKKLAAKGDMKAARKVLVMGIKRPATDTPSDDIQGSHSETALLGAGPAKKPKLSLLVKGKVKSGGKTKAVMDSTAESTPEAEISFKPIGKTISPGPSPGKMLLKNSMRPKTKIVKPVPRPPTLMVDAPAQPSSPFFINSEPTPYKTPPSSPNSLISAQQNGESSGHSNHVNHTNRASLYISEISTIPVMPVIPNSPSASNYKKYITKVPMLRPLPRRPGMGSDEEGVERRLSVRQTESAFKYKDIVVKKCNGYTQVWLATQTKMKNALNPKVMSELMQVLHNAKYDDTRLVLLSGSSSVFCSGVDLNFLMTGDQRIAAKAMTDAIREFIGVLISFPKPIVASVNGAAIGLGMALLPLCDIIYASDKASFYCPYARLSQTPEGCASFTFPQVMGMAMANEMLLGGRRLTALEAYQIGLVSQVFWPTSMNQEVIPRLQYMASQSGKALEASKLLIRSHQRTKLEFTNESECHLLFERWCAMDCPRIMCSYLDEEQDLLV